MNQETEQNVWRRVQGGNSLPADRALLPERLEQMYLEQRMLAESLGDLARRSGGSDRAVLNRLASENADRARELRTLHYLLTGRQLKLKLPREPGREPMEEALRRAYQAQRQAARSFRLLEREFSEYEEDFSAMAREADRHSRLISRVLNRKLGQN